MVHKQTKKTCSDLSEGDNIVKRDRGLTGMLKILIGSESRPPYRTKRLPPLEFLL
jgi:hypothetical protein